MDKVKFHSLLNKAKTLESVVGEPIYKWHYLDEKGQIQTDETNVQEMIQSYERQALNFKERIKAGEPINDRDGVYMDVSDVGTDYASLNQYLGSIVDSLEKQIYPKETKNDTSNTGANTAPDAETAPQGAKTDGTATEPTESPKARGDA